MTESGHLTVDCVFRAVMFPKSLQRQLDGIVEHRLFLDLASEVIVGRPGRIEVLHRIPNSNSTPDP